MLRIKYCCNCRKDTYHDVDDNCYCEKDQGAGYTYNDEHGNCNYCEDKKPVCTECNIAEE